ncbi:MAG: hypothetical protein HC905_21905 [Bacteroidales bacterium]|nr:hypothetical protein [Bacteroidales bacterium]
MGKKLKKAVRKVGSVVTSTVGGFFEGAEAGLIACGDNSIILGFSCAITGAAVGTVWGAGRGIYYLVSGNCYCVKCLGECACSTGECE